MQNTILRDEHMKKGKVVFLCVLALALMAFQVMASDSGQTHMIATPKFCFSDGSTVKFDNAEVYLGDSNGLWSWLGDDGMRFYNLRMGDSNCPNPWHIRIDNQANATINELFLSDKFVATVSASSGTTTNTDIYCGNYGKPKSVDGAGSWSYEDSTQTLTFSVTHTSDSVVTVSWGGSALGVYPLTVSVLQNGYPTIATVVITGAENQTVFGLPVTFNLPYGDYFIIVYCGDQRQTKSIFLSGPQSVGFDFTVSESPNWAVLAWTIPVFIAVVVGIYFLLFRKK